jgi:hypothetical protein
MTPSGHQFEDRLWDDLVASHGAELGAAERDAAPTRFRRLRWSGAAAAATVAAVVGLLVAGSGSPAAFAVTPHADGSVTISLRNVAAVRAANQALSRLHTRVVIIPAGAPACEILSAPLPRRVPVTSAKARARFVASGVGTVTIPRTRGAGEVIALKVLPRGNRLELRGYLFRPAVCGVIRLRPGSALPAPSTVTTPNPRSTSNS